MAAAVAALPDPNPTGGIALEGVAKSFGHTRALASVSLTIDPGEFFVVLGPSGCGKSTLLRLIAGLEAPDAGTICLGDTLVAGGGQAVPPERRDVAVVFQSYALWPHMSVRGNVAFPTETASVSREEARATVDRALAAVSLTALAERRPAALSGGQQQRVALARCLASRARTVLMDEPLANLDPHLRAAMEDELAAFHRASGATTLYITHDQREAMALATRIAVMHAGRILQVDAPQAIYERPADETVARFIGRGTLVPCEVVDRKTVRVGATPVTADMPAGTAPGPATLLIRPQRVTLTPDGPFEGAVMATTYRGGTFEVLLDAPGLPPVAAVADSHPAGRVRFAITRGWVLPQGAP